MPTDWLREPAMTPSGTARREAVERQRQLTKPAGSLGRLEALAIELAALQRRARPAVDRVWISLFAADHGIAVHPVSAYPREVTAQMLANYANGGAAINALAETLDARLEVIDVGTLAPEVANGVIDARIAAGTADISRDDAMTPDQLAQALRTGRDAVERALADASELFVAGEMGIGNTSSAAALASACLSLPARRLVGAGTGLDHAGVQRKTKRLEQALARHAGARLTPLQILRAWGGFEIAAITGAYLRCAQRGLPALVDGFITSAAALLATRIEPRCRDWLIFAHVSAEPGHRLILEALDATPLLSLGMRLGEASGAACAVSLLRMACAIHNHMATFADAGVTEAP